MPLEQTLAAIRELDQLPALLQELGVTPAWEPLPDAFWGGRFQSMGDVPASAVIGFSGPLPWFGIPGRPSSRVARTIARYLQTRGEPGGIAVLDADGRELTLSVAFDDLPALTVSIGAADPVHLACLRRMAGAAPEGLLARAAHLAESIRGEGVGTRFFRAFETHLERMSGALGKNIPGDQRHSLALLQLTRVLFLYFVQSKGWLDARPDFLRVGVDRCLAARRNLHKHLLEPLFFGTLNRRESERGPAARELGRIPFLNGGLFEPHPLERRWKTAIPNPTWREAFDQLFERFHFTVSEGSSTSIAPDMLGRVFEGVMAPAERRNSGTFYTPPALVRSLIEESLIALVVERMGVTRDHADGMLRQRDPAIGPVLQTLALLDPAVGSGAFLLGALEHLTQLRAGRDPPWVVRRQILLKNLFGVDVNPAAVRLTELRLWLAVIADDPAEDAGAVRPLPNLDCLVRQGDSLADPLALIARMPFQAGMMGSVLAELRQAFLASTGREKRDAARALREAELTALRECFARAETQIERSIQESLYAARAPDLFGEAAGARAARARVKDLRKRWLPIREARRRLDRQEEVPWFQYESHFADVFARQGGFDLVIGNPPWVRAEQLAPVVREQLRERYHWWRSDSGRKAGYRHQPDLAVAFLERAHELAAPGGVVALLLPAKVATAGYGAAARRCLARDLTVHLAADITGGENSFDATVYPMMLVSGKSRPPKNHLVQLTPGDSTAARIPQRHLEGGGPWVLGNPEAAVIARRMGSQHPPMGGQFGIHLGVKTGANEVFLQFPADVEPSLIRQAFRGRDLRPFHLRHTAPLLWPCTDRGDPLTRLPPHAARHFQRHHRRLLARNDYRRGPPWTLFRTGPATALHRVVWADLAARLTAVALSGEDVRGVIPLNTCYVMPVAGNWEAWALTAWLNSTWVRGLARLGADPASGGFARFNAAAMSRIPLPLSARRDRKLAEFARHAAQHSCDQDTLDELARAHLDLSPAERKTLAAVAGVGTGHRR